MNLNYQKVAALLDVVAEYVDGIEHQKTSADMSARSERISKLASSYTASTGESLPEPLKQKLAGLDQDTLDHLLKVAKNTGDSPESLGGPADIDDELPPPRTIKEAAAKADESFLNWIVNE